MLAKDVLALTKVNWNTTQFDQKLPAPIKAAREVGRISRTSISGRRSRRTSAATHKVSGQIKLRASDRAFSCHSDAGRGPRGANGRFFSPS